MTHGLDGFQQGCRCPSCSEAESIRLEKISEAETLRWSQTNWDADLHWAQYVERSRRAEQKSRPWSAADIAIVRDRSIPVGVAAAKLRRSYNSVSLKRHRLARLDVIQFRKFDIEQQTDDEAREPL